MGISIRDGKYLSGARKIFEADFAAITIYSNSSSYLELNAVTLDELSLANNAQIVIPTSQQAGLYYLDIYISFSPITAGSAGDNFDLALYNNTSFSYPDIEDMGYGYHFIMNNSDAYCRHSFIADLTNGISYTLAIKNNNATDYDVSGNRIRIYKL